MKNYFLTSFLLCVSVGFAALAGPVNDQDDYPPEPSGTIEEADVSTLAAAAVELSKLDAEIAAEEADFTGRKVAGNYIAAANSIEFLASEGVSDPELAPLVKLTQELRATLEAAQPLFKKGLTCGSYAASVEEDGQDNPATLFRAAALYCDAASYFNKTQDVFKDVDTIIAEAKAIATKLFEELDNKKDKEAG